MQELISAMELVSTGFFTGIGFAWGVWMFCFVLFIIYRDKIGDIWER